VTRALLAGLAAGCFVLPGAAGASTLPAGRLFGLQCVKAASDSYPCAVSLSPVLDGGEAVATSPTGNFVWAGGADGTLWTLRRLAAGRLAPVGTNAISHFKSVDSLAASPDGRDLYAVDTGSAGSGTLHVLHVRGDGRLSDGGCFDQADACGPARNIPSLSQAADVAVSGDGRNVYVAAGAPSNAVSTFKRAGDGSLTFLGCVADSAATCSGAVAPGMAGAHGVEVSPKGGSVYVASTGANFGGTPDGSVASLARSSIDGSLTAGGCVDQTGAPPPCASSGPGLVDPYAVVASGESVYVASRDGSSGAASSVTTLRRQAGGGISYGSCYAFTGSSQCGPGRAVPGIDNAFDIVMSKDQRTVHATALSSSGRGAVATFNRSPTGALSPAGCLGQFGSPEAGCARTRAIESATEAIDVAPDGASVYAGTAAGLAVLGREVPPVCRNTTVTVPGRRTSMPVHCLDLNGDALIHEAITGPAHGDLGDFHDAGGTVEYRAEPGFVGADFLTFRAHAGSLDSNAGTTHITVTNVRPSVTRFRLSRKRFRRGRKLARLARRRRARVGTTIRFRLSEPARVTLSFERRRGRRYRKIRTKIKVRADSGGNSLRFQGRLSRRKRLGRGRYRVTIVARDRQGLRSGRRRATFSIVR